MAIDSWRIRKHKPQLLASLAAYDQIKLSTFCTPFHILHRRISLAACCFEMGWHQQGFERIEEMEVAVTEGEALKASLGEEWLEQVVETASMHSTLEQSRVLEEFCRRVGLSVAALGERVWRIEREGQLERMLEEPLGVSEVSDFMW